MNEIFFKKVWKQTQVGNLVFKIQGKDWYISFNDGMNRPEFLVLMDKMLGIENTPETALFYNGDFDILEGDYRTEVNNLDSENLEDYQRLFEKIGKWKFKRGLPV